MKFLLKQLRLFFPFVFPMYDVTPGGEGGNVRITAREYVELLKCKKEVIKLEAQVKELEHTLAVVKSYDEGFKEDENGQYQFL